MFGGVLVFNGLHVWTADSPAKQKMTEWIDVLEVIKARKPMIVVAGHTKVGASFDATAIDYTSNYLQAFITEMEKAKNSQDLHAAMKKLYPDAGMQVALDIGAKVVTGEMKWG